MKFDKAYCVELGEVVTPYAARDCHFDETGELYLRKLSFRCEDELCRMALAGVNIYAVRRIKMPLHFRTWPGGEHTRECLIVKGGPAKLSASQPGRAAGGGEAGFKPSYFPDVFLLERPDHVHKGGAGLAPGEGSARPRSAARQGTGRSGGGEGITEYATSFLENVVDCYNTASPGELRSHRLRIGNITKTYDQIFKRTIYFKDGPGLIYYGAVDQVRNYGGDFSIRFRDLIWEGEKRIRMSIYLKKALIDEYRRSRLLRETLHEMSAGGGVIMCYFVGSYPELKRVRKVVDGIETEFDAYEVEIKNLDHLVVAFT